MQCDGEKNASKRTARHGEVFKRIFLTVRSPTCQLVLRPHFFCGLFLSDMVTKKSVLLSCSRRHHQNAQWNWIRIQVFHISEILCASIFSMKLTKCAIFDKEVLPELKILKNGQYRAFISFFFE